MPKSTLASDWKRTTLITLAVIVVVGIGMVGGVLAAALRGMPPITSLAPRPSTSTLLYDRYGQLLAAVHGAQNRIPVDLATIPKHVQNAFIATEDERFWMHHGVDLRGGLRAFYVILQGKPLQGGSTITMQLARMSFLNLDRTWKRKIQEIYLALQLERLYTKGEVLDLYLNQIFLGANAYGVQSAAQYYFAKDVSQLTLAEAALLAGITKAPNEYSPYTNLGMAKVQQELALSLMVKNKFVDRREADEALKQKLVLQQGKPSAAKYPAPYFIDYVLKQLLEKFGAKAVYEGGMKVYTTIDLPAQEAAEKALKTHLDQVFPYKSGGDNLEAAVVVLENKTGQILALVGGRQHESKLGLIRATESKRQPGSALKPLVVYSLALAQGYAPSYVLDDAPVVFKPGDGTDWRPMNYEKTFRGLVTIRYAVENSINVPAAKMLNILGPQAGVENAINMGINTLHTSGPYTDVGLAAALGGLTDGAIPLEMVSAYTAFANGGVIVSPTAITKVVDRKGIVLDEAKPRQKVVMTEQVAYLMTDILKGVITRGTGGGANIERPQAGKTGTTNDHVDAWFIGYTPQLSGGVWIGYDKPRKSTLLGGIYPAFIWRDTMQVAHRNIAKTDFPTPSGISGPLAVCSKSGLLPSALCPSSAITQDIFLKGKEPTASCDTHVQANICIVSGKLASDRCPVKTPRIFIRRKERWEPYIYQEPGQAPVTLIPQDANQEVPSETCTFHGSPP